MTGMRRKRIYEGKAKVLFEGPEPGTVVQYFKDDATAFNNQKTGVITGKGVLNNRISEYFMVRLSEVGIPTHFVRRLNMREQLVREVEIIPSRWWSATSRPAPSPSASRWKRARPCPAPSSSTT